MEALESLTVANIMASERADLEKYQSSIEEKLELKPELSGLSFEQMDGLIAEAKEEEAETLAALKAEYEAAVSKVMTETRAKTDPISSITRMIQIYNGRVELMDKFDADSTEDEGSTSQQ